MWCAHVDASVMQWPATLACLVHFEQTITRKDNLNRYDTRKFLQRSTRTRGFIQRVFTHWWFRPWRTRGPVEAKCKHLTGF